MRIGRSITAIGFGLAAVAGCQPAVAGTRMSPSDQERARIVGLARDLTARTMPRGDREMAFELERARPREKLGPHFVYPTLPEGPIFEIGALGAGAPGAPKLMHMGLNWRF